MGKTIVTDVEKLFIEEMYQNTNDIILSEDFYMVEALIPDNYFDKGLFDNTSDSIF